MKPIFVTGLPGVGKTAAIQELQKRGVDAIDSDAALQQEAGISVRDYFLKVGETAFRHHEKKVIRQVAQSHKVISLGGGAFLDEKPKGFVIYLKDDPINSLKRLLESKGVPAYLNPNDVQNSYLKLALSRETIYSLQADVILDVKDQNPVEIAHQILQVLVRSYGIE